MLSSLSSPSTISMFSAVEDLQDDSLAPLLTHHAAFEETVSVRVIHSDSECQKSKRKYWATCSSARSLVRSHHWYACYALLASLARSLARSLTRSGRIFLCNFQGDLSHCVIVYLFQYLCPYRCCYGGTFEYVWLCNRVLFCCMLLLDIGITAPIFCGFWPRGCVCAHAWVHVYRVIHIKVSFGIFRINLVSKGKNNNNI